MISWLLAVAFAGGFLASLEDIPTPAGFEERGEFAAFDAPQGRIVTTQAFGPGEAAAAARFYEESLPALGWRPDSGEGLRFRRGNEALALDIVTEADGRVSVRYRLITTISVSEGASNQE